VRVTRVLLIEDDEDNYVLTRQWLGEIPFKKYDLHWANSFERALQSLDEGEYDVCLLDYRLGPDSGLDLLKKIGAAELPMAVILMTGAEQMEIDIEAMRLGATDYLVKGQITPDMLERAIRYAMERKRTEALLQESKQAAEAASQAKSTFLSNISHELRTPLSVILGNAEILDSRDIAKMDPAEIKAFTADIHGNGRYLLDLINDLLDLSKAEADRIELLEDEVELTGVIENALALVAGLPKAADLTFGCDPDPALSGLYADAKRLKQILVNLLTNAVKFTPAGGRISVATKLDRLSRPCIEVNDTGIGIHPEDLARINEPFVQIAGAHGADSLSGTGLGLPLTKRLVELHGGTIDLTSTPGIGTRVTVTFPAERVL
jgi:signal transduction histidine kinase